MLIYIADSKKEVPESIMNYQGKIHVIANANSFVPAMFLSIRDNLVCHYTDEQPTDTIGLAFLVGRIAGEGAEDDIFIIASEEIEKAYVGRILSNANGANITISSWHEGAAPKGEKAKKAKGSRRKKETKNTEATPVKLDDDALPGVNKPTETDDTGEEADKETAGNMKASTRRSKKFRFKKLLKDNGISEEDADIAWGALQELIPGSGAIGFKAILDVKKVLASPAFDPEKVMEIIGDKLDKYKE